MNNQVFLEFPRVQSQTSQDRHECVIHRWPYHDKDQHKDPSTNLQEMVHWKLTLTPLTGKASHTHWPRAYKWWKDFSHWLCLAWSGPDSCTVTDPIRFALAEIYRNWLRELCSLVTAPQWAGEWGGWWPGESSATWVSKVRWTSWERCVGVDSVSNFPFLVLVSHCASLEFQLAGILAMISFRHYKSCELLSFTSPTPHTHIPNRGLRALRNPSGHPIQFILISAS